MSARNWLDEPVERVPGSLELAFLGDTVYDYFVRRHLLTRGGHMKELQRAAAERVCAHAQSEALARLEELLSEEERAVVRRARNAKQHPPHRADPAEYQRATGLEALLGWLCVRGDMARVSELMRAAIAYLDAALEQEKHIKGE